MILYLTLGVDLVKGIAWPVVVFVLIHAFRQPLKEFNPQVRKARSNQRATSIQNDFRSGRGRRRRAWL
jgi:hypothetical protein